MGVTRFGIAHRLAQQLVPPRLAEELLPAQNEGHAHQRVVNDIGQVIRRPAVGLLDNEIVLLIDGDRDLAEDLIHDRHILQRIEKSHDDRLAVPLHFLRIFVRGE